MMYAILIGDALEFMSWFLNAAHQALNGTRKLKSSIINKTFRGKMKVYTRKVLPIDLVDIYVYFSEMKSGLKCKKVNLVLSILDWLEFARLILCLLLYVNNYMNMFFSGTVKRT